MNRFSEGLGQRDGEKSELKRIEERELHVPHGPYLPPNQTRMRSLLSIQVNCFPSLVLSWRRNLRRDSLQTRTKDDKFAVDTSLHPDGEKQYFCVRRLEARSKGIEILLFPHFLHRKLLIIRQNVIHLRYCLVITCCCFEKIKGKFNRKTG